VTTIRSLLFVAWLYLSLAMFAVGLSPALLMPYRPAMWVIRNWARFCLFGLRWIAGVKVEFRGVEHMPVGACLIAGKHQSMLDVIAPFAALPDNCFIMKKELAPLPFFGWFAVKTKMIAVDRSAHSKALKDMVRHPRPGRRAPRLQARHRRPLSRPRLPLHPDGDQLRRPLARAWVPPVSGDGGL
jgi:1-acyl-sn-glycerol-3-phosphate acyltransferase